MNINRIKEILTMYGAIRAQHTLLAALDRSPTLLKRQLDILSAWLGLLTEEERFVIEKHLVGQLAWPYVLVEYDHRWGRRLARDERSLKRYQARALEKIEACVNAHGLGDEINRLFDKSA